MGTDIAESTGGTRNGGELGIFDEVGFLGRLPYSPAAGARKTPA